jgi:hypothetical protein
LTKFALGVSGPGELAEIPGQLNRSMQHYLEVAGAMGSTTKPADFDLTAPWTSFSADLRVQMQYN